MNTTRRRILRAASGGSLASLAGCAAADLFDTTPPARSSDGFRRSPDPSGTDAVDENTLTIGLTEMPTGLDPLATEHPPSRVVIHQLFEGLYEYDGGVTPVPRLANGPPAVSNEARRWIAELRDGVKFQDGSPVRPSDVKYSFVAPAEESTAIASTVDDVDRVSVLDDRTVQFDLAQPDPSFVHRLTLPVVPERARTADPIAFGREDPVGSGPFELAGWAPDGSVELQRASTYWGDRSPNLDRLSFTGIDQPADRATNLRDGPADVVAVHDNTTWSAVADVETARISAVPRVRYYYLAFNCLEGPTADARVREAVDYVFDMDIAVTEATGPIGSRQFSPVPRPVAEAWRMPVDQWRDVHHGKDVDRAATLFDEAGVPSDYPWRIIVPPDDPREQIARRVADGLVETGFVDTTVSRLEWGAFYGQYASGNQDDYNMYLLGWRNVPDPDAFTYPLFARDSAVLGVTNGSYFGANSKRGQEAARKFVRARQTVRRTARRRLYVDGITAVLEERAHLPAYTLNTAFGVNSYVNDLRVEPTEDQVQVVGRNNNTNLASGATESASRTDA